MNNANTLETELNVTRIHQYWLSSAQTTFSFHLFGLFFQRLLQTKLDFPKASEGEPLGLLKQDFIRPDVFPNQQCQSTEGKGNVDLYSAYTWNISKALSYSTHCQGISQFYLHTLHFIHKRNEPYLPWPSQPQLVLIYWDPGGMKGWADLGTK